MALRLAPGLALTDVFDFADPVGLTPFSVLLVDSSLYHLVDGHLTFSDLAAGPLGSSALPRARVQLRHYAGTSSTLLTVRAHTCCSSPTRPGPRETVRPSPWPRVQSYATSLA